MFLNGFSCRYAKRSHPTGFGGQTRPVAGVDHSLPDRVAGVELVQLGVHKVLESTDDSKQFLKSK